MRKTILQYLRLTGEQLESQIALGTGISIEDVRNVLSDLSASRDLITCHVVRFEDGKQIEGTLYRVSAYLPPKSPGRKSKAQLGEREQPVEHEEA